MFTVLTITISFLSSLMITFVYLKFATYLNIKSKPHAGSIRDDSVPTSAGIALALLYYCLLIIIDQFHNLPISYKYSLIFGTSLMVVTGLLDDLINLSSKIRLLIQLMFVLLVVYLFDSITFFYEKNNLIFILYSLLTLISSMWLINTFNFMDGVDGLVATNSLLFSLFGGLYFYLSTEINLAISMWALSGLNLGFLFFNWSPAKIFMGDSGSLFLGSTFTVFILGSIFNSQISVFVWLILFSIFYVETTVTLIVRLWRKRNVFKEHHSLHAYQRLVIESKDHSKPAKLSIVIQIFWTLPLSLACFYFPKYSLSLLIFTLLPMILIFYYFGPKQTKN